MPAIVQVDAATERLRNGALLALGFVYLLPAVYALPPNLNIVLTATLTVFTAGLRTVGKTHEAEMLSQKVRYARCSAPGVSKALLRAREFFVTRASAHAGGSMQRRQGCSSEN